MDFVAHSLWAAAAAKAANRRLARPLRVGWAAWWGMFPDLFAFGPQVAVMGWIRLTYWAQGIEPEGFGRGARHGIPGFQLSSDLYKISHGLLIFAAVFGLVWLLARRPVWELLAWPLHILMDIPTHTLRFYPTPFLWPLSSYRFGGISWGAPWFIALNYGALITVFVLLRRRRRRRGGCNGSHGRRPRQAGTEASTRWPR